MSLEKVTGSACLDYINRMVGFGSHSISGGTIRNILLNANAHVKREGTSEDISSSGIYVTHLFRWRHDSSKRKVGLVLGTSEDGGYEVALLGNETIANGVYSSVDDPGWCDYTSIRYSCGLRQHYTYQLIGNKYHRDDAFSVYPTCSIYGAIGTHGVPAYSIDINEQFNYLNFDESNNYIPRWTYTSSAQPFHDNWRYNGQTTQSQAYNLTTNKNTTMIFGHRALNIYEFPKFYKDDPLKVLGGNLYQWACDVAFALEPYFPPDILNSAFENYDLEFQLEDVDINNNKGCNLTSVPYNIILTYDENQAKRYLQDGTLPSDAFLFPLDFDNLPKYQSDETDDSDEDDGGDGDADDNGRDTDENLPEVPPYTPGSLNNNNVYLMTPGELNQIINWLWNDVGDVQDIDDLVTKIEGLTSDLTQNLLMVRVMPVAPSWIGGLGSTGNFVIGAVEKAGQYTTLGKNNPTIENIGYWDFSEKFSSFKFLNFAPYSEFKLFLPYHGIVDLDVSVFQGHRLNVKAVYDYLTGTITYMLYCDNTWLVNTYTAKMAVDLAITLQTKADRDSAIFNNVSNAVAGVMTAGSSIAAGNPIGLVLGAQSLTQQGQSAPFKAMGQVGETGAFYAPQKCAVLVRRPVYRKPKTYNSSVGRQSYKSYTLAKLKGKGYTKIINPRLEFTKTQPLAEEVQELNDILSSGVIL